MRLFIFNNLKLKAVITGNYQAGQSLWKIFGPEIEAKLINGDSRKAVLWATARRNMTLADASLSGLTGQEQDHNKRYILNPSNIGIDYYLDRSTGWIGLASNYSIVAEWQPSNNGNGSFNLDQAIVKGQKIPWQQLNETDSKYLNNLLTGITSLVPLGIGNFYGKSYALPLADFKSLSTITQKLSEGVKAAISVEWFAVAFDHGLAKERIAAQQETLNMQIDEIDAAIQVLQDESNNNQTKLEDVQKKHTDLKQKNSKSDLSTLIMLGTEIQERKGINKVISEKIAQAQNNEAIIQQGFAPFAAYGELAQNHDTEAQKKQFDGTIKLYLDKRFNLIKNLSLTEQELLADTKANGWYTYMQHLMQLERSLVVVYRQLRITLSDGHFNSSELDKTTKQKAWSYFLFGLGSFCKVLGVLSGAFSASGLPGVGPTKTSFGIGGVVKELFTHASAYFFNKKSLYDQGGKADTVEESLDNMLNLIIISYAAFEIFFMQWGVASLVTGRSVEQITRKIEKVAAYMKVKASSAGLSTINPLELELDQSNFINPKKKEIGTQTADAQN